MPTDVRPGRLVDQAPDEYDRDVRLRPLGRDAVSQSAHVGYHYDRRGPSRCPRGTPLAADHQLTLPDATPVRAGPGLRSREHQLSAQRARASDTAADLRGTHRNHVRPAARRASSGGGREANGR